MCSEHVLVCDTCVCLWGLKWKTKSNIWLCVWCSAQRCVTSPSCARPSCEFPQKLLHNRLAVLAPSVRYRFLFCLKFTGRIYIDFYCTNSAKEHVHLPSLYCMCYLYKPWASVHTLLLWTDTESGILQALSKVKRGEHSLKLLSSSLCFVDGFHFWLHNVTLWAQKNILSGDLKHFVGKSESEEF